MYDPPAYVWALVIVGAVAIPAAACIGLYGGATRAGLSRGRAILLGGGAAALLGGWFVATAVIAGHGFYNTRPSQVPWGAVAGAGFLCTLLVFGRIPAVARALRARGMARSLVLPHSFRVVGVFFLFYWALGRLPALFALPSGLGDIGAGIAAPLVARSLGQGSGRRAAIWFNVYGLTDLAVDLTLGTLMGFQLINVTPSTAPAFQLPLALIITADVPLMIALHIASLRALVRPPRPAPSAASLLASGAAPTAATPGPAGREK